MAPAQGKTAYFTQRPLAHRFIGVPSKGFIPASCEAPAPPLLGNAAMSDWKPNVTVAAVIEHQGRFLIIEERTVAGVRLNQPAGHLEAGETLARACVREALEETAHHVEVVSGIGVYLARFVHEASATDVTYLRFAFACRLADRPGGAFESGRVLDEGILRTHWLSAAELRARGDEHRSPLVMQVVDDHLAGQRFDLDVLHAGAGFAGLPFTPVIQR